MEGTGSKNRSASGGFWQNSRTNPVLPSTCGLRVGLVLDLSGSTSGALPQLKQAANTFVDSLVGTPSSMSLFSFSYDSPADGATQNFPTLTPVSTQGQADAFKARYANWSAGGGTNWDRGLAVAAEAANRFDVVVVITDGNPTNYGSPRQGSGSFNRIREVENGIFSANAIKAEAARVLGFGVGDAITADSNAGLNLRAISGPTEYNGSNTDTADFYRTADYAAAGAALKALAQGNCQGSITVVKQVVPSTAAGGVDCRGDPCRRMGHGCRGVARGIGGCADVADDGRRHRSGQFSADIHWRHHHRARHRHGDTAGGLHASAGGRRQRGLCPKRYRRVDPGHQLGRVGLRGGRCHQLSGVLHDLQPGTEPGSERGARQDLDRRRHDLRRR